MKEEKMNEKVGMTPTINELLNNANTVFEEVPVNSCKLSGFHPNGNTGCLVLDDEYFMGIRCNHLAWVEGTFEDSDSPAVMLIGNHKGNLVIQFAFVK